MHQTIKCPHCGEPVSVDLDYDLYYHEECGNDIKIEEVTS